MKRFTVHRLRKWSEIHRFFRTGAGKSWIYRGQRLAKWPLQTTLERCYDWYGIRKSSREQIEEDLVRDFKRAYHEYARHVPHPRCIPEWLSIMEHYGAPTRLLDFTYSIYVAAYFALEKSDARGSCAVWAVNRKWAVRHSLTAMKNKAEELHVNEFDRNCSEKDERHFEEIFWKRPRLAFSYVLTPFRLNERLRIQKGTFLVPGDITIGFEENLKAMHGFNDRKNVVKIVIPASLRKEALKNLYYMNISRTSLFPGLEGHARSFGVYHSLFERSRRLGRSTQKPALRWDGPSTT